MMRIAVFLMGMSLAGEVMALEIPVNCQATYQVTAENEDGSMILVEKETMATKAALAYTTGKVASWKGKVKDRQFEVVAGCQKKSVGAVGFAGLELAIVEKDEIVSSTVVNLKQQSANLSVTVWNQDPVEEKERYRHLRWFVDCQWTGDAPAC